MSNSNIKKVRRSINSINRNSKRRRQEIYAIKIDNGHGLLGYKNFRELILTETNISSATAYREVKRAKAELTIHSGDMESIGDEREAALDYFIALCEQFGQKKALLFWQKAKRRCKNSKVTKTSLVQVFESRKQTANKGDASKRKTVKTYCEQDNLLHIKEKISELSDFEFDELMKFLKDNFI